jgi:hypothetical protein
LINVQEVARLAYLVYLWRKAKLGDRVRRSELLRSGTIQV